MAWLGPRVERELEIKTGMSEREEKLKQNKTKPNKLTTKTKQNQKTTQ